MKRSGLSNRDPISIFICAGEVSGDQRGAELIASLRKISKRPLQLFGAGGERLASEGVSLIHSVDEMSVMGFQEVLSNIKKLAQIRKDLASAIKKEKPDVVVLVDYPGMNLRLAGAARKAGVPVFYYISPKVWAWGKGRIRKIRRSVNLMTVIFPFEETFYAENGVPVIYVGNPLCDILPPVTSDNINSRKNDLVALLPGSRVQEVKRILPVMLNGAELMVEKKKKNYQFQIAASSNVPSDIYDGIFRKYNKINVNISGQNTYSLLEKCGVAMVASGTATLEAALIGTPMVVIYKTGLLTYGISKALLDIPYISLVNLVAGKEIVKELIQKEADGETISRECIDILENERRRKFLFENYMEIRTILDEGRNVNRSASMLAATALSKMIDGKL